ncbi:MAG: carboxylating nicotinate-nucleotide diphosphorylase [Thermaerobacter sp.]|nr:carboxylating nicotinate-nucleotide diphosphorylase [Thermaerobacter sp.]
MNVWHWDRLARWGLQEDVGFGDWTTEAVTEPGQTGRIALIAREDLVVSGLPALLAVYRAIDPNISVVLHAEEGTAVAASSVLAWVAGPAGGLLTGERVALNILQHLSGIATVTRSAVDRVRDLPTQILDTRKTLPGWRVFEKYAVRCGGGRNHRFGLDDAVLIKDNHIAAAGGVAAAAARVRARVGPLLPIEIEIDRIEQIPEALAAKPAALLLDNMVPATLRQAVSLIGGQVWTEASGNIRPDGVRAVAETGVNAISLGWLTHSARAVDVSADWVGMA